MYQERRSRLAGSVVWRRRDSGENVRILPDGSMDLIWTSTGELFVAGPDTRAQMYVGRAGQSLVGVRFAPGVGPSVLGVPARELRNERVSLDSIWKPADARRLADRIAAAPDPGLIIEAAAQERVAAQQLSATDRPAATIAEIVRLVRSGRRVSEIADAVGLSERQLRRWSLDAFGYGPKTLARILRLGRAVELARAGAPFAALAHDVGYADQAHLARDVRSLTGVSLTALGP